MKFRPTDILLNADGSVYHLAVPFGVLPSTIITVGDQDRVDLVASQFDAVLYRFGKREFKTVIGRVGSREVAVVSTGIGTDNVEIVLQELDFLTNIHPGNLTVKDKIHSLHVVRIGTTGAMQATLEPGMAIVSQAAVGFDALMHLYAFPQGEQNQLYPDHLLAAELNLDFTPYHAASSWGMFNITAKRFAAVGLTATAPGFYAPQGRRTRAAMKFSLLDALAALELEDQPAFTNFEMETSGLFALGILLGHHVASVSLVVANRASDTYLAEAERPMEQLIGNVLASL